MWQITLQLELGAVLPIHRLGDKTIAWFTNKNPEIWVSIVDFLSFEGVSWELH